MPKIGDKIQLHSECGEEDFCFLTTFSQLLAHRYATKLVKKGINIIVLTNKDDGNSLDIYASNSPSLAEAEQIARY